MSATRLAKEVTRMVRTLRRVRAACAGRWAGGGRAAVADRIAVVGVLVLALVLERLPVVAQLLLQLLGAVGSLDGLGQVLLGVGDQPAPGQLVQAPDRAADGFAGGQAPLD